MNRRHIADRGQVLIIFVFAIVGLIGMTGLAIDGGNIFSDRRHAQNAADTAALAGALVKVRQEKAGATDCTDIDSTPSTCGAKIINATLDRAAENGYSNGAANAAVAIHIPPLEGAYSDCTAHAFNCYDYVEVVIDSQVNTFFARVLGIPTLHNHVEAVARSRFKPSSKLYSGSALVALDPGESCDSSSEFYVSGNSKLTLVGSGIFINSECPVAFKEESGCIDMKFYDSSTPPQLLYPVYDEYGNIKDPGNLQGVPGAGSHNASCVDVPVLHTDGQQQQFPPDEPFGQPAECGKPHQASHKNADGYTHLFPGYYTGAQFPPGNDSAFLDPGVYCVEGLVKINNPKTNLVGHDVMIYIKPGGGFALEGGDTILSAITTETSPYKGFVIYVAPNYNLGTPPKCKMTGTAATSITGVIWAPYCDVELGGSSVPQGNNAQIIAYNIKIVGGTDMMFTWNGDDAPTVPEVNQVGLYH